uniref:Uncharacterized protein n=1 Tax=Polysiphonia sp. TaxID=1967842 RepID=A0A1Z1M4F0_9FLOR|nr:hypothetical protein [Polysiphonia sp.]
MIYPSKKGTKQDLLKISLSDVCVLVENEEDKRKYKALVTYIKFPVKPLPS